MASEQFSLCWDNFHKNMSSGMNSLLENEDLVDVTLAVQGKCLKAHKMVLSVCSPYFKELFKSNPCKHPIVFMKDVSYEALSDLLQFMYQGEVQVSQENLTTFIKTAEALQIKGLTGDGNGSTDSDVTEVPIEKPQIAQTEEYKPVPRPRKQPQLSTSSMPSVKRQRLSVSSNEPLPPIPAQPVTKIEPVAPPQPISIPPEPAAVHFKMEPYDQTQNLIDESGDDNFGDETLDETVGDDTEDYSMMDSGTGEEQPGTSAEAGEGQALPDKLQYNIKSGRNFLKNSIIIDGFSYHHNNTKKSKTRYTVCAEYKKLACKARGIFSVDGSFILRNEHNHPPLFVASLKDEILRQIKTAIINFPLKNPKEIYDQINEMYPEAASLCPFNKIKSSMRRWRRTICQSNQPGTELK